MLNTQTKPIRKNNSHISPKELDITNTMIKKKLESKLMSDKTFLVYLNSPDFFDDISERNFQNLTDFIKKKTLEIKNNNNININNEQINNNINNEQYTNINNLFNITLEILISSFIARKYLNIENSRLKAFVKNKLNAEELDFLNEFQHRKVVKWETLVSNCFLNVISLIEKIEILTESNISKLEEFFNNEEILKEFKENFAVEFNENFCGLFQFYCEKTIFKPLKENFYFNRQNLKIFTEILEKRTKIEFPTTKTINFLIENINSNFFLKEKELNIEKFCFLEKLFANLNEDQQIEVLIKLNLYETDFNKQETESLKGFLMSVGIEFDDLKGLN